jgi:predicted O-methyltransferase YrrM
MELNFTSDWVTPKIKLWQRALKEFSNQPNLLMIEVGCYEGRSALWFLENILTETTSSIICIDPYIKPSFEGNTILFKHKIRVIKQPSQRALRDTFFTDAKADLIYIDGSHNAADVLEDAILCFRILKKNGILIFDDYLWTKEGELTEPKIGIDAFLNVFRDKLVVLHKQYNVIIQKI